MPNLTDLTVRNLPEGLHLDTRLTSFGIRVGKTKKTWIVIKGQNRTKVSLGHYPAVSLHDARKKALVALASPEEAADRIVPKPFLEVVETYLEQQAATLRPVSLYQINRTLRRHFKWQKQLNQITHNDVALAIDAIDAPSERAQRPSGVLQLVYSPPSPVVALRRYQEAASEVTRPRAQR